jgi:hypothetical protein
MRGRYLLMVEAIIGMLGGDELRRAAARTLGYRPQPDELYRTADCMLMVETAALHGVAPARVGAMVMPKCKQSVPGLFPRGRATRRAMVESMDRVNKSETDFEPFSLECIAPNRLTLTRASNPYACAFTVGFVEGLLRVYGHKGSVTEARCRWYGDEACVFEVELTKPMA